MRIQPTIGVVVDHATGRTGQPDASGEHEQGPPRRGTAGRQPQRPPGRPQQQQHADRPIATGQFPVLAQTLAPARRRGSFKTFVAHLRRISGGGDGARLHPGRRRHRPILPPRRQRTVAPRACHPPDFTRSENAHWAARRLRVSYAVCAPVAQPDRVVASEAIGRGFESLRARHPFFPFAVLADVRSTSNAILGLVERFPSICRSHGPPWRRHPLPVFPDHVDTHDWASKTPRFGARRPLRRCRRPDENEPAVRRHGRGPGSVQDGKVCRSRVQALPATSSRPTGIRVEPAGIPECCGWPGQRGIRFPRRIARPYLSPTTLDVITCKR